MKNPAAELKFQDFEFTESSKIPCTHNLVQSTINRHFCIVATEGNDTSGFGLGEKSAWNNLNHYAKYFNVTTEEVKQRIISAMLADGAFLEHLNGRMDFYGPAWISISIAIMLFVCSSLNKRTWSHPGEALDFNHLTMGIIEMILFTTFQTASSWGFFRWRAVDGVKVGEMASLTGYSLVPLFPAMVVSMIPWSLVQWAAFGAAAACSCVFIHRNLWPILVTSPSIRQEQAALFMTLFLAVHVIFFLALRVAFYTHHHVANPGA